MANIVAGMVYGDVIVDNSITPTTVKVELLDVKHGTSLGVQSVPVSTASVTFSNLTVPVDGMDCAAHITNLDQNGNMIGVLVVTPTINIPSTMKSVSVVTSGNLTTA